MTSHPGTRLTLAIVAAVTFVTTIATADDDAPAKDLANKVDTKADSAEKGQEPPPPQKLGVLLNDSRALPGYNLINPGRKQTYLFDNEGRVVHTWTSEYSSGAAVYLLDNGHLFRPAEAPNREQGFQGPAASGRIQEFDWDGNLVWDFEYHSEKRMPHHDAIKLPNGNALLICWERIDEEEAVARGRRPETVKESHLQPDCLVEIKPTGPTAGEVVWEWRSWDHLIQDLDRTKPNYGKISDHPERFDVNYVHGEEDQRQPKSDQPPAVRKNPDWMHVNALAYNPELDQVALSSPHFNEIWILDHGTTTEEARGHTGGRWGKGGDLLYRWGNPRAYRNGTNLDQRLFFQHNIQWIAKGLPGEGHLLVFNNGGGRKPNEYSSVDEFVPPTDEEGNYVRPKRSPFGPDKALWSYTAPNPADFFSWFISGTQRLPNGNTLINSGAVGVVFEVTPENEIVWKFANPFKRPPPGRPAAAGPPKRFESLGGPIRDALGLTAEQRKRLDEIDGELLAKLEKILTAEEIKQFAEPAPGDDADFSKQPPGVYLAMFNRSTPPLTEAQREALQALQTEFSSKIAEILNDAQKTLIADRKKRQLDAATARGAPRRQGNTLFRATRYALNHPAFTGRTLEPGKTLVELEEEFDQQKSEAGPAASAGPAGAGQK
jgi:hypothetical protein